jgi:carnitine 3-dehydrogenase
VTAPIALVGCGLIGTGWAAYLVARGLSVRTWDPQPGFERRVHAAVDRHAAALGVDDDARTTMHASARVYATLDACLDGAVFVQESAPEDAATKRALFAAIDALLPADVAVASSSTALLMTPLQRGLAHPERFLLGHPFNPVEWMPLVEVSGGEETAPDILDAAEAFYRRIGKRPVRLHREIEGHIAGRLSAALYREAVHLVESGVASVEAVDAAIVNGPGLRWAAVGPHLAYHLGGGEGGLEAYFERLGDSQERRWATLGAPRLTPELRAHLVAEMERAVAGRSVAELEARRDALLQRLLDAIRRADDAAPTSSPDTPGTPDAA